MLTPEDMELYWRIRNNPYKRAGMPFEAAMIFSDTVRHELAKLDEMSQFILQAKAAGYTIGEMARMQRVSLRTMDRCIGAYRRRAA